MLKRILLLIALALVASSLVSPAMAQETAGHRAVTGINSYPEQSLKALQYVKRYGGTVAEGDVQFTSDGYAVMLHDTTLDRTTNCSGYISRHTFAQLRKCAPHTVVPQLLFWLREVKRLGLVAVVELKGNTTDHQMRVFARTVRAEAPRDIVVASFYPHILDKSEAALGSRAKYAPIIAPKGSPFGYSVSEHAKKYDIILADFHWLIVARVKWYHNAGVEVWGWTGKTSDDIRRLKALKVDVIIADDVRKVTGR